MRRILNNQAGISMVEVVVAVGITAAAAAAAVPYIKDYGINARLREAGSALLTEAMAAQYEAIKRGGPVNLVVAGNAISVVASNNPGNPLRSRNLGQGLTATNAVVSFGATGALAPLGLAPAARLEVFMNGDTCSSELRCPAVLIQVGGGMRICGNKQNC